MSLAECGNPVLDALVAARLGLKSTIEETRLEKLIALAQFDTPSVPAKISGAHTHSLSSDDGINMQNLPSGRIDGQTDAMRVAIEAPEGCVIVAGDSKQVEARTLAYEANQRDLLHLFATGGDPYVDVAADAIREGARRALPEDRHFVTWQ
jgi:DNA polymerase I-like protein with 3'-5' exonuclease and polymerase domains